MLSIIVRTSFQESGAILSGVTIEHYSGLFRNSYALGTLANTAVFTVVTTATALLFGIPAAWLVERTDLPGKRVVVVMMTVGLLIPTFFTAMGWLLMFHPRIGAVNTVLRSLLGEEWTLNIVSLPGMGLVQGMSLSAIAFVLVSASFRAMDPSLEESAQMCGGRFVSTMRRITLPLAFPSLLAAVLYVLTIAISVFDVPAIIGMSNRIFTFSTFLYVETHPQEGLPQYELAASFGSLMIAFALILSWWYSRTLRQAKRYQVVRGKSYRPTVLRLGRQWKIAAWSFLGGYLLLSKILPIALMAWVSLLPFAMPPSVEAFREVSLDSFRDIPWSLFSEGLTNTLLLAIGVPLVTLAVSFSFTWIILRTRTKLRYGYDFVAFLPHAVPNILFAMGALLASLFIVLGPVDLYGSMTLLFVVLAIVFLSFATRITNAALMQINRELEEAAYVAGGSTTQVLWRILVPLLRPAFAYVLLWICLLTVKDLTIPMMLFSPDNITLSVVIWGIFATGDIPGAAATSLVLMTGMAPLILGYLRLNDQRPA